MTAHPYRIAPTGRPRPAGLVTLVMVAVVMVTLAMVVLVLAATALVSVTAAHHTGHGAQAPATVHDSETAHDHQPGSGWAPQPHRRVRATVERAPFVPVVPGHVAAVGGMPVAVPDQGLDLLGVLRI